MLTKKSSNVDNQHETNQWFDDFISNLRIEQDLLNADVLEKNKREIYEAMISGNDDFMHNYARKSSSAFFIKNLIDSYLIELAERKVVPKKIALELSDAKVLVWAEIKNDDEASEDNLILAAAKVNSQFSKYGFHISSTIVEENDKLNVPKHYREVLIK